MLPPRPTPVCSGRLLWTAVATVAAVTTVAVFLLGESVMQSASYIEHADGDDAHHYDLLQHRRGRVVI